MVEVLYEWFPFGEERRAEVSNPVSTKLEFIVCLQNNAIWSVHKGVGGNGVDEVSWCVQFSSTAMSL